jgi:hypothetical protein
VTTRTRPSPANPGDNPATQPPLTTRTTLILLIAVLAGCACGWLTVQAGHPLPEGVLSGTGAAVAAARIFAGLIRP